MFVAYYAASWWDIDASQSLPENFRTDKAHNIFHRIAYAESDDGVSWRKPSLKLVDAPAGIDKSKHAPFPSPKGSTKENNLGVPFIIVADLGTSGNVDDPDRRYALRLFPDGAVGAGASWEHEERGYFSASIPDFVNDSNWRDKLVDSGGCFNPRRHVVHFWDDVHGEWVATDQGVTGHWLPSREIARFASKDLVNWESTSVIYPDSADPHRLDCYDEPMQMRPFHAEGIAFGLLSWFHSDRSHPDAGPNLVPSPERPEVWPWCRKGTNEMRITISRDGGLTWDRTSNREAWIPHGTEHDSYDRLVISALPPAEVGDEDWFYTEVLDGDHLGIRNDLEQTLYNHDRHPLHQTALYVQKRNRYVSLTTQSYPEVLITEPMMVDGDRLELNVDAGRGRVRVGIALVEPVPTFGDTTPSSAAHMYESRFLPGFSLDDCGVVRANSTAHVVKFAGENGVGSLHGKPVRLAIETTNADLYGFRIASD